MKNSAHIFCVVATCLLSSLPAFAQSASASSSAGAPLFTIQNFQGDARCGDLYSYMHPTTPEPWDAYRRRLQQAAQAVENLEPTQLSPSPENAGNSAATVLSTINAAAGSASSALQSQNQYSTEASAQPQVTTDVTGQVLGTGAVPGLVEP